MLFSHRYLRALERKALAVEISEAARRKLWSWLKANDESMIVQRDPNNNWTDNSSILAEIESDLMTEHGWDQVPGARDSQSYAGGLRHLVLHGDGEFVLDVLELASSFRGAGGEDRFRKKVNEIFELHDCPWRMSDGEFFKLDQDFVGARLAATAHDSLAANNFSGAVEEYAKARQYLGSGEAREAIYFAGHSFESVMKVLTGLERGNATTLISELAARGFFDDLPENVRRGFVDQVLKALPFLRNNLGGHGQGAAVVKIPPLYGHLTVQLAAAFHNFLVGKHLERSSPPVLPKPELDDEIPF